MAATRLQTTATSSWTTARRATGIGVLFLVALLLPACEEGLITAPEGSTITLVANPPQITATGESEISALVRLQDGTPVRANREVLFFTSLGEITESADTNDHGIAVAILRGSGQTGTATVRAISGGAAEATLDVVIGTLTGTIALQATPGSIPDTGGVIQLVAVVLDQQGNPLEGATVIFSTELGSLASGGGVVVTDSSGEARDTLTVTAAQARNDADGAFVVAAETSGNGGEPIVDEFTVNISQVAPNAAFSVASAGPTSVQFLNESTGQAPLSFTWDFQNDGVTDSTARDPVFDYGAPGMYTVELVATNSAGTDTVVQSVTVPVP